MNEPIPGLRNGPSEERAVAHFRPFALSADSMRRRIASDRWGVSSCCCAHLSTAERSSSDRRIAVTGSWPVAGLPLLFFVVRLLTAAIFM